MPNLKSGILTILASEYKDSLNQKTICLEWGIYFLSVTIKMESKKWKCTLNTKNFSKSKDNTSRVIILFDNNSYITSQLLFIVKYYFRILY